MDIWAELAEVKEAQKKLAALLGDIGDAIVHIRADMKLLTSNENLVNLSEYVQRLAVSLQQTQQDLEKTNAALANETSLRIAGDSALTGNIQSTNESVVALGTRADNIQSQVTNNMNEIATINGGIGAIQQAARAMPKIQAFCKAVSDEASYVLKSYVTSASDGNGFLRLSMSTAGISNNDIIVSIQPYDARVTSYSGAVIGWTDYSSDSTINIQAKWIGSSAQWDNASGMRFKIWFARYPEYKGMSVS